MSTSTLAFDIAQFFPSLNHCLFSLILGKAEFESRVVNFFSNYLVNRMTNYSWNNFSSHLFDVNVEVFKSRFFKHFSRFHGTFNPLSLNISSIRGLSLISKDTWKYLGFIFDRKLCFHQHIDFYTNKAIFTVKCMKILGNLSRGLNPQQKRLLYRSCALPIALYGF